MDWTVFIILLMACGAAATTGAAFEPGDWYQSLKKPSWTPPNWLFPVAWSVLYICMSVAGARVAGLEGGATALALWGLQIALNTLWTPIFFGKQDMRKGMIVLVMLWMAVAATMLSMFALDTLAGLLFMPYLVWVTVAGALNWSVWSLNPKPN